MAPTEQPSPQNPLHDDSFSKLVRDLLEHFHVPGLSVAVVTEDTVFAEGYGIAQMPNVLATPKTLYYAGSTTKSFTAAALAMLMQDKKDTPETFGWKTPVCSLIRDDFVLQDEYATTHATLEDLACHRTGFGRHDLAYGGEDVTTRDMVRRMRHLPMRGAFRDEYDYNNLMWMTLGHVAERVSDMPLGDLWRTRVWGPLGMKSTTARLADAQQAERQGDAKLARGYYWDKSVKEYVHVPYIDISAAGGCGCIISNVVDYAEYLRMMINRAEPLSEDAHDQLRSARVVTKAIEKELPITGASTYALGWSSYIYRGVEVIGHGGGIPGFGALMNYVPSKRFGVAMFGNTAETSNFVEEILFHALLDNLLGTPEQERFDWAKYFDEQQAKQEAEQKETMQKTYPKIADPPLPPSLPLEAYKGTYGSAGYQNLTFTLAHPENPLIPRSPGPAKDTVLIANAIERTWPHIVELEHVTGDYFLAWVSYCEPQLADGGRQLIEGVAAEFRLGADGKVTELGIAMEQSMKDTKIWYCRKQDDET